MKDVLRKSTTAHMGLDDASIASTKLSLGDELLPVSQKGTFSGTSSITMLSLALSMGTTGVFLYGYPQMSYAAETTALLPLQSHLPISQGDTFMIPAPVTLATIPEIQSPVETSQFIAAKNPSSTSRVEPELPVIKHIVEGNETLWSISKQYDVSLEAIARLNEISSTADLVPGQAIKIPPFANPAIAVATERSLHQTPLQVAVVPSEPIQLSPEAESSLQAKQDEALSTLRAKQQSLAENVSSADTQSSTEVVFDAKILKDSQPTTTFSFNQLQQNNTSTIISSDIKEINSQKTVFTLNGDNNDEETSQLLANQPVSQSSRLSKLRNADNSAQQLVGANESKTEEPDSLTTASQHQPIQESQAVEEQVQLKLEVASETKPSSQRQNAMKQVSDPTDFQLVAASTPAASKIHTVRPGETLYSIARRYGLSGGELIAFNRLSNPNVIKVNQKLMIPVQNASQHQNQIAALLPETTVTQEVNHRSETLASVESLNNQREEAIKPRINFEANTDSAVDKLKADIARMRQGYQQKPLEETTAISAVGGERTSSKEQQVTVAINPEWQSSQNQTVDQEINTLPEDSQELAAAPTDAVDYNSLLRLSVGDVVAPNLPPLASPDPYLPNGAETFNGHIWPAKGVLTSGYGWRWGRMHKGIDIAAPVGTPIFASAGGEVISAGWNSGGFGNLVEVKHSDGSITRYAHNSRILVRKGQQVKQGQQVATMGSTGFSTGPHLHFEIHPKGQGAINPIALLPKK